MLDPFLGSELTLVVAEEAGRACRGAEIDPVYADVIVRRFEAVTGKTDILLETRGGADPVELFAPIFGVPDEG